MRGAAIFAVAVLAACRPEPAAISEPAPFAEPTAEVGTAIAIAELGELWEHRAVVGADGALEVPHCGATTVAGATASGVCERVATCLATVLREPLVEIAFERERASCRAQGEPLPEKDALLETVATRLAAESFEEHATTEIVDTIVARHEALLHRTETHPDVRAQAERVQRLLESARLDHAIAERAAGEHVALRLVEALHEHNELSDELGPKHPQMQQVTRRLDALRILETAVGTTPLPPSLAYVLAHERALVQGQPPPELAPVCPGSDTAFDRRIAYWQGRRDASIDPSAAETILEGLVRARIDTLARCSPATRTPRP